MNNITIAGKLGKDIEVKFLPNGDSVGNFSVADQNARDKPTIWWNCQLWGKRIESLAPYLGKGQPVTVTGNITEREWTSKDGIKQKSMDVRVNDIFLQGGKREEGPTQDRPKQAKAALPDDGFQDDIPF